MAPESLLDHGAMTELAAFDAQRDALDEVLADHPGKTVYLIGGESGAKPASLADLRAVHRVAALAAPSTDRTGAPPTLESP